MKGYIDTVELSSMIIEDELLKDNEAKTVWRDSFKKLSEGISSNEFSGESDFQNIAKDNANSPAHLVLSHNRVVDLHKPLEMFSTFSAFTNKELESFNFQELLELKVELNATPTSALLGPSIGLDGFKDSNEKDTMMLFFDNRNNLVFQGIWGWSSSLVFDFISAVTIMNLFRSSIDLIGVSHTVKLFNRIQAEDGAFKSRSSLSDRCLNELLNSIIEASQIIEKDNIHFEWLYEIQFRNYFES